MGSGRMIGGRHGGERGLKQDQRIAIVDSVGERRASQ